MLPARAEIALGCMPCAYATGGLCLCAGAFALSFINSLLHCPIPRHNPCINADHHPVLRCSGRRLYHQPRKVRKRCGEQGMRLRASAAVDKASGMKNGQKRIGPAPAQSFELIFYGKRCHAVGQGVCRQSRGCEHHVHWMAAAGRKDFIYGGKAPQHGSRIRGAVSAALRLYTAEINPDWAAGVGKRYGPQPCARQREPGIALFTPRLVFDIINRKHDHFRRVQYSQKRLSERRQGMNDY